MRKTLLHTLLASGIFCTNAVGQGNTFYDMSTIQSIQIQFARSDWDFLLDSMAAAGDDYSIAQSVTINGQTFQNVGVKYKGNSSYNANNAKNSFAIKLDHQINTQNYQGYESLKLNNTFKDPSMVREALGYEIARKYMPAPQSNFAKVTVNGSWSGLYTNVEDLNKHFLSQYFKDNDGYFFKCDPTIGSPTPSGCNAGGAALEYLGADSACFYSKYEIQSAAGWGTLRTLTQTLNSTPAQVASILDVDRALWMLAYNNVLANLDSYSGSGHNYYIYYDNNFRYHTLPWDLNEAFGVFMNAGQAGNLTSTSIKTMSPTLQSTSSNRPLIQKLLSIPAYKKLYIAHIRTILKDNFTNSWYFQRAQALQAVINTERQAETNSLYTYPQFQQNLSSTVTGGMGGGILGIRELMQPRDSFLRQHSELLNQPPTVSNNQISPLTPVVGSAVTFTVSVSNASSVQFRYRNNRWDVFQSLAMYDDGTHGDITSGDNVFSVQLSANPSTQYYFYTENAVAAYTLPENAEMHYFELLGSVQASARTVVINEFMAADSTVQADPAGEYDDWIELYNTTAQSIDLSTYYLSDNFTAPSKWKFPNGTTIAANGYLIVWADNDTFQTGLHAYYKLNAAGEELILTDGNGAVLDSVSFGRQTTDISYGRYPNGTGNFGMMRATYNANNSPFLSVFSVNNEQSNTWTAKVFPNPNHTFAPAFLALTGNIDTKVQVHIFDPLGKLVHTQTHYFQNDNIQLPELAEGMYLIKIQNYDSIRTVKYMVR